MHSRLQLLIASKGGGGGAKAQTESQMMAVLNIARPDVHQKYTEKKEMLNIQALVNALHVNAAIS